MAVKLRERPGKGWYVYIDWKGKRKAKAFGKNKALAKEFAKTMEAKLQLGDFGIDKNHGVKFEEYGQTWLDRIRHTRKHSTFKDYEGLLNREFLPAFKCLNLEDITREKVKNLAFACLRKGQSAKTVHNLIRALGSLIGHAVEDGLLTLNPAAKPGKFLPVISKARATNPYSREEVSMLLEACKEGFPRLFPLLLCAVRSGLRQGELIALHWGDIDFRGRFIEVRRSCSRGKLTTPKNGKVRRVDMSLELTQTLRNVHVERELETMQKGWKDMPPSVFCDDEGKPWRHNHLRKGLFYKAVKAAGLRHIRFHDLRHTFASLLLQQGESPVYVKEQMGHSSIQVTVDLYGHLIPGGNKQAVDRLDGPGEQNPFSEQSATQPQPMHPREGVLPS